MHRNCGKWMRNCGGFSGGQDWLLRSNLVGVLYLQSRGNTGFPLAFTRVFLLPVQRSLAVLAAGAPGSVGTIHLKFKSGPWWWEADGGR